MSNKKSTLSLMELAVMVMIFALAAVLCLRAFVWADGHSRLSEQRDRAAFCAQTAAEVMKNYRGDAAAVCEELSAAEEGTEIVAYYDSSWNVTSEPDAYVLRITPEETGDALLGQASVSVSPAEGEQLIALTVCWQEVA